METTTERCIRKTIEDIMDVTTWAEFCLVTYEDLRPTCRRFTAEKAITWGEARDRLIKAGIMDADMAGRTTTDGGWMLSVAKDDNQGVGEPMP